jgi:hypothetical protein
MVNRRGQPIDPTRSVRRDGRLYCEAKTRRQFESGTWDGANDPCGNLASTVVDGHPVCRVHADPDKRYGWN